MPKKGAKLKKWRKNSATAIAGAGASAGSGVLIPLGPGAARAVGEKETQRALRELEKARARLEEFEKADRPAFSLWYHRTFGRELTELRAWTRKAEALRPPKEEMRRRRTEPDPRGEALPLPEGLKSEYRALAKRLHPDSRSSDDARRDGLWLRAQAAYEKGDLEELRVVAALCGEGGPVPLADLRSQAASLRRRTLKAKRDPAWGFSRSPGFAAVLEPHLRRELEQAVAEARGRYEELEAASRRTRSRHRR